MKVLTFRGLLQNEHGTRFTTWTSARTINEARAVLRRLYPLCKVISLKREALV